MILSLDHTFQYFFVCKPMYQFWLWSNQFGYMFNYISVRSKLKAKAKITHQPPNSMVGEAKHKSVICLKIITSIAKQISFTKSGDISDKNQCSTMKLSIHYLPV